MSLLRKTVEDSYDGKHIDVGSRFRLPFTGEKTTKAPVYHPDTGVKIGTQNLYGGPFYHELFEDADGNLPAGLEKLIKQKDRYNASGIFDWNIHADVNQQIYVIAAQMYTNSSDRHIKGLGYLLVCATNRLKHGKAVNIIEQAERYHSKEKRKEIASAISAAKKEAKKKI